MQNKITIYRHKTDKNIYLIRIWNICGGGPETEFYKATDSFEIAIKNALEEGVWGSKFNDWMGSFIDPETGKTKLTANIILRKDLEFDGYKGILTKTISYPVHEFEPIDIVEPE